MTAESDYLVDRRKMRRRLAIWRIVAVIAVVAAVGAFAVLSAPEEFFEDSKRSDHIARITVSGVITDSRSMLKLIKSVKKSKRAKGVIISVSSPGGTASGGEALYEALRDLSEDKPTVTHVSALAASAGYMIAMSSDHIVARSNAITGSIGVLFQYADASSLLETVGVKFDAIKSGEVKAEPNFYSPPPEAAKEMLRQLVDDSFQWFVALVEDRRSLDSDTLEAVTNGAVFTGRQAMARGLVDAVGGEEVAVRWLGETHSIDTDLPVVDWRIQRQSSSGLGAQALALVGRVFGLELNPFLEGSQAVALDGLVSVWHGPATNQTKAYDGAVGQQ